jgi:hypothetical protein
MVQTGPSAVSAAGRIPAATVPWRDCAWQLLCPMWRMDAPDLPRASTSLLAASSVRESDDRGCAQSCPEWRRSRITGVLQGPPNGCHGTALIAVGMALLRQVRMCSQTRGAHGRTTFLCAGFAVFQGGQVLSGVLDCT